MCLCDCLMFFALCCVVAFRVRVRGFDCLEKCCVVRRAAQHVAFRLVADTSIDRSLDEWPLLQLMLQTTQPSLAISKDHVSFLQNCQKAITLWQSERAKMLLQQSNGSTCLVWYSNDTHHCAQGPPKEAW